MKRARIDIGNNAQPAKKPKLRGLAAWAAFATSSTPSNTINDEKIEKEEEEKEERKGIEIEENMEDAEEIYENVEISKEPLDFNNSIKYCLFQEIEKNGINNYRKGVKFSPDDTCILSCSEDNVLRVYEVPNNIKEKEEKENEEGNNQISVVKNVVPVLSSFEGETVYDYAWYPYMNSSSPSTCFFASSSRDNPIHIWDAYNGSLVTTFKAINHLDEIDSPISLCFNNNGDKLFCGSNRMIRIFDITRPGPQIESRPTCKTKKSRKGQRGIISCIAFNPDYSGMYAAGSYARSTYIYSEENGEVFSSMEGHDGGVTQVQFAPNGKYLLTGGRKDDDILCWDIRNTGDILYKFKRNAKTNQKIFFDIHPSGNYVATGSVDNRVLVYSLQTGELDASLEGFPDAVHGVSFSSSGSKFATSTGQRHFSISSKDGGDDEDDDVYVNKKMNELAIWSVNTKI